MLNCLVSKIRQGIPAGFISVIALHNMDDTEKDASEKQDSKERRPTPWTDRPLRDVRDVFDRMLDERMWLEPLEFLRAPRLLSRFDKVFFPRIDVSETDTEVKVVADVPGIDSDDIDIDVRDNRMIISGEIEQETDSPSRKPYSYERTHGSFRREFVLPARVKEDQVKAVCKDGMLTVTMQKIEQEKRKRIPIEKG